MGLLYNLMWGTHSIFLIKTKKMVFLEPLIENLEMLGSDLYVLCFGDYQKFLEEILVM